MSPKPQRQTNEAILKEVRWKPCCICGRGPVDAAHIVSRGAGGPDTAWNVIPLCRGHHTEQHKMGWFRMAAKYPPLSFKLTALGWEWDGARPFHPELPRARQGL